MKPNNYSASVCRHCKYFNPEGRRGGMCSQLNVLVKSHWKSCSFACAIFDHDWQPLPEIAVLEKSFTLGCATPSGHLEIEKKVISKQQDEQPNFDREETILS